MIEIWWTFLFMLVGSNAISLARRNTSEYTKLSLSYSSDVSMYYINGILVGNPPQSLENVVLDTGSSDLVLSQSAFNPQKSTSLVDSDQQYAIEYGSTDTITIDMVFDIVKGTNWKITNYTFFASNSSDIDSFGGVMGIGYSSLEVAEEYENIPLALQSQGLSQSTLYSIDGRDGTGSIIFGGIDNNAFVGALYKTPIVYEVGAKSARSYYNVLAVTVNTVYINGKVVSSEKLMYTIDSGSNALAVTEPILNNIEFILGSSQTVDNTTYYKSDSVTDTVITFDITGIFVSFPLSELIDETVYIDGLQHVSLRIVTVKIGIDSYEGTIPNALLKYYYTVFDLENNQVLLANYSSLSTDSIVPISGSQFAVSTQTAPNYKDIYTSMYDDTKETTISTKKQSTNTPLQSSALNSNPSSLSTTASNLLASATSNPSNNSQSVIHSSTNTPYSSLISYIKSTHPTDTTTPTSSDNPSSAANKVCKNKSASK